MENLKDIIGTAKDIIHVCRDTRSDASARGTLEITNEKAIALADAFLRFQDLLPALEGLIDVADDDEVMDHDFSGCEDCALCIARRAVAKAKGES